MGAAVKPISFKLAMVLLGVGVTTSCDRSDTIGTILAPSEDAGIDRTPEGVEICGNGLDDNGNGLVDEDCPCASGSTQPCYPGDPYTRHIGSCSDGIQHCLGGEMGTWGPCEGATLPAEEECNGLDDNCDGSVDEGCRCTPGDWHPCGVEGPVPCRLGEQVCDPDGYWQPCRGMVLPVPEVCDGVDNDCNGEVDDIPECACGSEVEICDNGIDDNCNGLIDEEPCEPPVCVPSPEICGNGVDDDCDGVIDNGCEQDCSLAPPRLIAPLSTSTPTRSRPTLFWELAAGTQGALVELCADRSCEVVLARTGGSASGRPDRALPPGPVFWRAFGATKSAIGCTPSPTWLMYLGHGSTPVDTSWGTIFDVNGDGWPDVAIGDRMAKEGPIIDPQIYLFHGSGSGLMATPSTVIESPLASPPESWAPNFDFGYAMASAGDTNGDGYADLIVGSPRHRHYHSLTSNSKSDGHAFIFLGGPEGLSDTPANSLYLPDTEGLHFGSAVAGIGDVNGDGYGDVVIAALPNAFHIYLGGPEGVSEVPAYILEHPAPPRWYNTSSPLPDIFAPCDVNGDRRPDLAVLWNGSGFLTVFLGKESGGFDRIHPTHANNTTFSGGIATGDVNGNGYCDLLLGGQRLSLLPGGPSGTAMLPTLLFPALGIPLNGSHIGIGSAGDINGDGFSDMLISGASDRPKPALTDGRVFLYPGSPSSLAKVPLHTWDPPSETSQMYGPVVAGMGDVDGDRLTDFLVGSPLHEDGIVSVFLSSSLQAPSMVLTGSDDRRGFGRSITSTAGGGR